MVTVEHLSPPYPAAYTLARGGGGMMPKTFFTRIVFVLLLSNLLYTTTHGQSDSSRFYNHRNIIAVDPLFLAFGYATCSYDRALSPKLSLYTSLIFANLEDRSTVDSVVHEFMAGAQLRFHPFAKAPRGFFTGGSLLYQRLWYISQIDTPPYTEIFIPDYFPHSCENAISVAPIVGYQFVIKKRVALEAFFGVGLNFWWQTYYHRSMYTLEGRFMPTLGVNVGYAFD